MIKILIGIPVLDNIAISKVCLQHLFCNTDTSKLNLDVSVLIIDNGSQSNIEHLLQSDLRKSPFPFYFLKNPQNLGVATAWNQILKFTPEKESQRSFPYDYYVISNNDALFGPDWLQPLVEAMEIDEKIGWISTMENGSPVLSELIEAHSLSKKYRVDPKKPYTGEIITKGLDFIYEKWGGHNAFCLFIKNKHLPLFIPYKGACRSAVCFMVRPTMIKQIGFFDEDYPPVGIAEDLEYFLRMEQILMPPWLTKEIYPPNEKWKSGFCGQSIVHHNWCSTHQGPNFDGRKWSKMREKHWKAKFGKSKKYYSSLLP